MSSGATWRHRRRCRGSGYRHCRSSSAFIARDSTNMLFERDDLRIDISKKFRLERCYRKVASYYDVPPEYHVDRGYRYTIVNDRPVLVDPASRRVVDVIE
jgi:hypothetical protein